MLKNISKLGKVLDKSKQRKISGGFNGCDTVPLPAIYKSFCEFIKN